jgi:hypothetical protein
LVHNTPRETHLLTLTFLAMMAALGLYLRKVLRGETEPRPGLTDDQIKRKWRQLGFFCELDNEKRIWTLTGSRAGLLYFPDLLLGYVNDPQHASDRAREHYGPYGTLEVMTYPDAGFDGHAIRGSLSDLPRLAELVEAKLASAQPGEPISIREEFAADSPYTLELDVRPDGFDPASADRERLGSVPQVRQKTTTERPE